MYDYGYYGYSAPRASVGGGWIPIVAFILGLAATILLYVFVFPKSKEDKLPKFFKFVKDFFGLKYLVIEKIAKFLYVLETLVIILTGFFLLFGRTFLIGLLLMLLGPIVARLLYELFMLGILLVKNVMEINSKIKGDASGATTQFDATPEIPLPVKAPQEEKVCPQCGAPVKEGDAFCSACGQKLE